MAAFVKPEEMLIEILARLPVKSLIRFTCVCKHWLYLIRSPEFATIHYATRSRHHECDSLLSAFQPGCSIFKYSYQDFTFETAFKFRPAVVYEPPRFGIHHRDVISDCWLFGPCNGLFLIQLWKGGDDLVLLLWNPATRQVFKLPSENGFGCGCLGFGFDPITNDYKVVGFRGHMSFSKDVRVYSLATNSWRQLDGALDEIDTAGGVSCPTDSVSNARMYHWILTRTTGFDFEANSSLLSFDMVDEVFVETPLPIDETRSCYYRGFLYRGSNYLYPTLCYTDNIVEHGTRGMHIWVLKGYGTTGLWNKQHYIRLPEEIMFRRPMVLWKDKAIVSGYYDKITLYDLATREIQPLPIPEDRCHSNIIGYTESLVSIASIVRHPPPADHSSIDISSGGLLHDHRHDISIAIYPENHEHDGDDDDSSIDSTDSTDSAFLAPEGTSYLDYNTIYIDYETDLKFSSHRKNEWQKLRKLPYCLREVNQPMISNPYTF